MPPAAATAAGRATSKLKQAPERYAAGGYSASALLDPPLRIERRAPAPAAPVRTQRPPAPAAPVRTQRAPAPAAPIRMLRPPAAAPVRTLRPPAPAAPVRTARPPAHPAPLRIERRPAPVPRRRSPEPRPLRVTGPERVFRDRPAPIVIEVPERRRRLGFLLLDRIVRGRAWIPVLAILLVGVVGMRVEVLKLGTRVGAAAQLETQLQGENQTLAAKVAVLGEPGRIHRLAAGYGMVQPGPEDDTFVSERSGRDLRAAVAAIHPPAPQAFEQSVASQDLAHYEASQAVTPVSQLTATIGG